MFSLRGIMADDGKPFLSFMGLGIALIRLATEYRHI